MVRLMQQFQRPPDGSTPSVVICAYATKRWDALASAVRSAALQQPRPSEVIVVIDHNDEFLQRARDAFPDVTVMPNTGPRGLSGARNTGLTAASSDIVAFLDDDAEAAGGWLAALIDAYEDPTVLGVGGSIEPRWPVEGQPTWWPTEFLWVLGCSYPGLPETRSPVRNLIGANMSLRRSEARMAGAFAHALGRVGAQPYGVEETALCIRMTQDNPSGRFLYEPSARVTHRVTAGRLRLWYLVSCCYNEGKGKAAISAASGHEQALSAERSFVRRTLPRGIVTILAQALRGNVRGLSRIGTMAAGLAAAAIGYTLGVCRRRVVAVSHRPG